LNILITT